MGRRSVHRIATLEGMEQLRDSFRREGRKVHFVPTMGALHDGHASLIDAAKREAGDDGIVVSSIFVNPAQFAPHEDIDVYPRTVESDVEKMAARGVEYVFLPTRDQLYPTVSGDAVGRNMDVVKVVPPGVDDLPHEGSARPGFFEGVSTVVAKLMNVVGPTHMYLGQKDGLQCIVVRRMISDLNFPVDLRICPTVREEDGLAMSSRNVYLGEEARKAAPDLYAALTTVAKSFQSGERSYGELTRLGRELLEKQPMFEVEYFSVSCGNSGKELDDGAPLPGERVMISAAVRFENCRILDNVLL